MLYESTIQRQIIDYLKMLFARGAVAWFCRVNGGMAQYGEQPVWNYTLSIPGFEDAHDGYSDLHGMLSDGRYFAIEVKRNRKKPTKPQQRFITVGDLSRQIGSGSHSTNEAARGAKGTAGKRLESQNLPFEGKP